MDLIDNPLLLRSLVLGAFAGAAIVLTVVYSRRGPLVFVPYAALLVLVGLLIARFAALPFTTRFSAALAAYLVATAHAYVAVILLARQQRQRLVAEGRLSPTAAIHPVPLRTRAWHVSLMLGLGGVASAAVAYVAG